MPTANHLLPPRPADPATHPASARPSPPRRVALGHLGGAAAWLALGLAGCAAQGPVTQVPQPSPSDDPAPDGIGRQEVAMMALGLVGTPYRFGGNTPQGGFDCSGLIAYVFGHAAGLRAPRTVRQLQEWGAPVEPTQALTGDLVFFGRGEIASHAGILVSRLRFVHAPSTGGTVRLEPLGSSYWRQNLRQVRRV